MLIAAQNPCPCSYYGDPVKECTCSLAMVTRYQKRISGPLLDRIDTLRDVDVPRVDAKREKLPDDRLGEPSSAIRARLEAARDSLRSQARRFAGTNLLTNGDTPALAAQVQVWGRRRCGRTARCMTQAGAC